MKVLPPDDCSIRDKALFLKHFSRRLEVEERVFNSSSESLYTYESAFQTVLPTELNGPETATMVTDFCPDACLVFGTDLIKSPVLEILPDETFNVHLGLSPWYRGSATLFWPFYFMEPQWAGVTVHRLVEAVDHGEVVFQTVPRLHKDMGIHDVACEAVVAACDKLLEMLIGMANGQRIVSQRQMSSGRIFRMRDFRPAHLRVNYEMFNDRMTESWLDGSLGGVVPQLVDLEFE
jgi:methionyl-tRNA formyltransferase